MNNYYHILEENYDAIGWHGYYENYNDALEEKDRLSNLFESSVFYVWQSDTTEEPPITTI